MDTQLKRSLVKRIRRNVAVSLRAYGFAHSKPSFFTRVAGRRVEFVHMHVFSSAPSFRIHLGFRDALDSFEAVALNGPTSEDAERRKDFDLNFSESTDSVLVCAAGVVKYVEMAGLPWFHAQQVSEAVPLKNSELSSSALTCKLLGIPNNLFNLDALMRAG